MLVSVLLHLSVLVICILYGECSLTHVQSFEGEVGAENFTYYKLVLKGHVLIRLQSLEGDADLYLSTETLRPTWDDYTIKSDTCSHDVVVVRKYQPRPIGIGVYGYVHYPISKYQLSVFVDNSQGRYYPDSDIEDEPSSNHITPKENPPEYAEEPEESAFWNFMLNFLRFLLEVLL